MGGDRAFCASLETEDENCGFQCPNFPIVHHISACANADFALIGAYGLGLRNLKDASYKIILTFPRAEDTDSRIVQVQAISPMGNIIALSLMGSEKITLLLFDCIKKILVPLSNSRTIRTMEFNPCGDMLCIGTHPGKIFGYKPYLLALVPLLGKKERTVQELIRALSSSEDCYFF